MPNGVCKAKKQPVRLASYHAAFLRGRESLWRRTLETAGPPHWRTLYEAAVLESDPDKLLGRIVEAQQAIMDRTEDLNWSEDSPEGVELLFALNALRDLRKMAESDVKHSEG